MYSSFVAIDMATIYARVVNKSPISGCGGWGPFLRQRLRSNGWAMADGGFDPRLNSERARRQAT